jgi:hypothetical protein
MAKWWQGIVLGAVLAAAGWFVGYGVYYKDKVDYRVCGPATWAASGMIIESYPNQEVGPVLAIRLQFRNRGPTDIGVAYEVRADYTVLSPNMTGPFNATYSDSVKLTGNSPDWGSIGLYAEPPNGSTFAIQIVYAAKIPDISFPNAAPNYFSQVASYGGTSLQYAAIPDTTGQYQLVPPSTSC